MVYQFKNDSLIICPYKVYIEKCNNTYYSITLHQTI